MHEGRRPSCISFHLNVGRRLQREGFLVNGLGCGTGGLPGVPGCDILELKIWVFTFSSGMDFLHGE